MSKNYWLYTANIHLDLIGYAMFAIATTYNSYCRNAFMATYMYNPGFKRET